MCPSHSLILSLTLSIFLSLKTSPSSSSSHYTNLVFKGCARQTDSNVLHRQTIKHLLRTLTALSSTARFHTATSYGGAVDGLFQCRGDLSGSACEACVRRASSMAPKLCGQAVAARIQLSGCYLRYAVSGFQQASGSELLYRICGSGRASPFGLEAALAEMVKGLESGSNNNGTAGFYAGGYQSVYVLGQCEGDLRGGECVECVKTAIDGARSECGSSISAQVYLQECFISYAYYPDGVPTNQKPFSSSGTAGRWNTQKTVAIVTGGLVGLGLVASCLLFTKSAFRKKTHTTYKYSG